MIVTGSRVSTTRDFPKSGVQTLNAAGFATFDLVKGDQGTAYFEHSPGIWIILFDKGPAEPVLISDAWLHLIETTPVEAQTEKVEPELKPCVCSMPTLMAQGCICGHWKRYVPPHKRMEESKNEAT